MKDLDFDELDRAVNSLMSNVPKSAPQTTITNEKTLDLGSSLSADSQAIPAQLENMAKKAAEQDASSVPASSMPTPTPPPAVAMTPRPAAPAIKTPDRPQPSTPAARRAGRFMDVVHPSSDMKKPEMPRPVSRQGVTIEPAGKAAPGEPIVQPKTFAPAPVMTETEKKPALEQESVSEVKPVEVPSSEAPAAPVDVQEPVVSTSDWPDPLDMATKNDAAAPLTSPFLADAKVEKRPLGGLSTSDMMDNDKKAESSITPEVTSEIVTTEPLQPTDEAEVKKDPESLDVDATSIEAPKLPGDEGIVAPLPEELRGDLMAVEADTTHDEIKQNHDSAAKQEHSSVHEEGHSAEVKESKPDSKSEQSAVTGPTSIPQQYHEEPSTGDQDSGAIYDTSTYHQPLTHPAKKKSGWLWVVWIVVILLLGAAGGAAIYFFKLV